MPNSVAYGFIGLQHILGQRVNQVGVGTVRDAIVDSTRAYNAELGALLRIWAEPTTTAKERVELPGDGTLQALDEWGNPLPVRPSGNYDTGYPIAGAGTAWGTNRVSAALLTIEEASRYTLDALRRDAIWMRQQMLAAIFDNVEYTYIDKLLGSVAVMPLANNDTVVYVLNGGIAPQTQNHYRAQAAAISDANNPFSIIYDELLHHPSNSEPFVVYAASNLIDSIQGLSAFVDQADPDILPGQNMARLTNSGTAQILGPGDHIVGKTNRMWVVEWRALPNNYMIGVSVGATPFLRMREYDSADIRGFFPEFHSPDGNLFVNRFLRYAGFGVRDRVAAVVYQIGNASYQIPAGYDAPLP